MIAANKKDLPLKAVRGVAAITVLLWHSMLGFFPQWSGIFPDKWPLEAALKGQVWFGLIYGRAAVTLFFVLSGFVLTRRFLLTGDQQIILRGAIKRWPRLTGPVLATVLASWLLFKLGAYHFTEGGAATGSPWLSRFAYAFEVPFEPNFWDALSQGVFSTFFQGYSYYDNSLWTMRFEFIGSFIAFGLALLVALIPKGTKFLRLAMIVVVFLLCYCTSPVYASFPAGVALATFLPERRCKLPGWAVAGLILLAIYLFGFTGAKVGAFILAARIFGHQEVAAQILASILVIIAIELASDTFRQRLSGRICELIGKLSFPLYLIHVLVLCSLGCTILIWAGTWTTGPYPSVIAGVATVIGSVLAAIPLVFLNERWVALVNTAANWLLSPPVSQRVFELDDPGAPAEVLMPN
ncbi:acyltransferase family protein [Rhodoblastus sp.]|uniref:acyltransferase family protein n=1 Tax=Rhodoblastus sp. TaxID=1962975 RepID=UPI003F9B1F01